MSPHPLRDALLEAVRLRRTGALTWADDPRKRILHLREGELIGLQSNLKSESPDRLRETDPALAGSTLARAVALARLRGALLATTGTVEWHSDARPASHDPQALIELLHALAELLPEVPVSWPRNAPGAAALVARLPVDAGVRSALLELHGDRPLDEVLAFAPTDPDTMRRCLRVLAALGAVEAHGDTAPAPAGPSTGSAEPPSAQPPAPVASSVAPVAPTPAPVAASTPTASEDLFGGALADLFSDMPAPAAAGARPAATPAPTPDGPDARVLREVARVKAAGDHFAVLGVTWEDPPDTMRRAYFALARGLHPDQLVDVSDDVARQAVEAFDAIRAAWEVLGDDTAREAYIARVIRGEKTEDERAMERVRVILDAEADFRRALTNFQAGRLQDAHAVFQRVAAEVPDSVEFICYAAYTRLKLATDAREAETAADVLYNAVNGNETFDAGWVLLGMAMRQRGNDSAAQRCFVKALKIKPANPDAARELRRLQREGGEPARDKAESAPGGFFSRLFGKK